MYINLVYCCCQQIEGLKERMKVLDNMDERLKFLDDFNKKLKEFDQVLKDMEEWNAKGRQRMDDLLKPGTNMLPEERVMYTMELQSDIAVQIDKHKEHDELWKSLMPSQDNEKSEQAEVGLVDWILMASADTTLFCRSLSTD